MPLMGSWQRQTRLCPRRVRLCASISNGFVVGRSWSIVSGPFMTHDSRQQCAIPFHNLPLVHAAEAPKLCSADSRSNIGPRTGPANRCKNAKYRRLRTNVNVASVSRSRFEAIPVPIIEPGSCSPERFTFCPSIYAIPKLLEILEIKGALVTLDAMGCQVVHGYLDLGRPQQTHAVGDDQ